MKAGSICLSHFTGHSTISPDIQTIFGMSLCLLAAWGDTAAGSPEWGVIFTSPQSPFNFK